MVDALLSLAIQKIDMYITGQLGIIDSVEPNAEWLWTELGFIEEYLEEYREELELKDRRSKRLFTELQKLTNDIISVLDDFTYQEAGGRLDNCRSFLCGREGNVIDVGKRMESLKGSVLEIKRIKDTYNVGDIRNKDTNGESSASGLNAFRRSMSYKDKQDIVGLEDAKKEVIDELFKPEQKRCIVSIHGMGGLGKTSLARSIYNSKEVAGHFEFRAWACVSQEENHKTLLQTIIRSFKKSHSSQEVEGLKGANETDLERYLRDMLESERYLVVVDDVRNKFFWNKLKHAFPNSDNGSRVIFTTRNSEIGMEVDEPNHAYALRNLKSDESWQLFERKILSVNGYVVSEETGREMLERCNGLPLVIILLGGMLAHRQKIEDWVKVKNNIWSHLSTQFIEVSALLSLSYKDLPKKIRPCFLYLGMFPEDHSIDAQQLMYLWMGEGLILKNEETEMEIEEVAESYLEDLINRSLIQVEERVWDTVSTVKMHGLLRNLAVEKASEVDLFGIYNPGTTTFSALAKHRWHVVHSGVQNYLSNGFSTTRLRSLVLLNTDKMQTKIPEVPALFGKRYNRLCVLKLESVLLPYELPNVMDHLILLKYLGLVKTRATLLPPSVGNLRSLQTLELLPNKRAECPLPIEISKLTNLRHLICRISGDVETGRNVDIGALSSLRTLKTIQYEHWSGINTVNLTNLRELVMDGIEKQIGKVYSLDSVKSLTLLHTLVLSSAKQTSFPPLDFLSSCENLRKLWLRGQINTLPEMPKSITVLNLAHSKLKEDPTSALGNLPYLRRLDLNKAHTSVTMCFLSTSFPNLEILHLHGLTELKSLEMEEGALPRIKCIYKKSCGGLKGEGIPKRLNAIIVPADDQYETKRPLKYFPRSHC